MNMSQRRLRTLLRWTHLVLATILGFYLYSPWGDLPPFAVLMQAVVFPLLVLTGLWMWQQARVRRLFDRRSRAE